MTQHRRKVVTFCIRHIKFKDKSILKGFQKEMYDCFQNKTIYDLSKSDV